MNYRIGDIIEIMHKKKLVTAKIVSFERNPKRVLVVLHNAKRKVSTNSMFNWSWNYSAYPKEPVLMEDIIRVVKRVRGKGYKKKKDIILIDKDGNITDK